MNTDVEGYEAFALYHTLKLHFTTKYDYVKYSGKCNITKEGFSIRKDKYFFYRLARKYKKDELFGFYVSNLIINPKIWIGNLLSEDCDSIYKVWEMSRHRRTYAFQNDMEKLSELVNNPADLLKVVDGQYPLLYNCYNQGDISIETIIIMADILGFFPMWQKKISDNILFPEFMRICEKYKPFLEYDSEKLKIIMRDKLCQAA